MARPVASAAVETSLRGALRKEGFTLTDRRAHGQTGVDIVATKGRKKLHIEVIAYKKKGTERAKDFYQSFFRVVSRLNDGAKRCILALPKQFERGLPRRADHHRVAWKRIGEAFPELEIWLVDTEQGGYEKTRWNDWLDRPKGGVVIRELAEFLRNVDKAGGGHRERPKRSLPMSRHRPAATRVEWTKQDGKRLRQAREAERLSQGMLAADVGCTGSRISELERNRISYERPTRPSPKLHRRLVAFFRDRGVDL